MEGRDGRSSTTLLSPKGRRIPGAAESSDDAIDDESLVSVPLCLVDEVSIEAVIGRDEPNTSVASRTVVFEKKRRLEGESM